jgi:hypothetical protein
MIGLHWIILREALRCLFAVPGCGKPDLKYSGQVRFSIISIMYLVMKSCRELPLFGI